MPSTRRPGRRGRPARVVLLAISLAGGGCGAGIGVARAESGGELPPTQPLPSLPEIEDPNPASARLVPVPPGCSVPDQERAIFLGTLIVKDVATARFQVEDVKSGSTAGFEVGGLIDVRYDDEVRFLEAGERYLVGTGVDPASGALVSRVRPPAPLFGGSDVAGLDDSDVPCPRIDDPVRTLLVDGTSVESGVLHPLTQAKGRIVRSIAEPFAVALLVLVGLVGLKLLVFALGRTLRDLGARPDLEQRRRREEALRPWRFRPARLRRVSGDR